MTLNGRREVCWIRKEQLPLSKEVCSLLLLHQWMRENLKGAADAISLRTGAVRGKGHGTREDTGGGKKTEEPKPKIRAVKGDGLRYRKPGEGTRRVVPKSSGSALGGLISTESRKAHPLHLAALIRRGLHN